MIRLRMLNRRAHHNDHAFSVLKRHIQETLVESEGAEFLASLHGRYVKELGVDSTYSAHSLREKISRTLPELKACKQCNKTVIILYNPALTEDGAIKRANFDQNSIVEAAYYLRNLVKHVEKNSENLPEPLSADALAKGQAEPPDYLIRFFTVLCTGSTGIV